MLTSNNYITYGIGYKELRANYKKVISYLLEHSDCFALMTTQKKPYSSIPAICRHDEALKPLKPFLLVCETDLTEWPGTGTDKQRHAVRMIYRSCREAEEILLSMPNIFRFSATAPEDFHCFRNGECWFTTVTHEKMAFLTVFRESDASFFRENEIPLTNFAPMWFEEDEEEMEKEKEEENKNKSRHIYLDCDKLRSHYSQLISYAMDTSQLFSILSERDFPSYKHREWLKPLEPFFVEQEEDYDYQPEFEDSYYQTHWIRVTYRCCSEAAEIVKQLPNLMEPAPEKPRNLCFFRDGELWLNLLPGIFPEETAIAYSVTKEDQAFFEPLEGNDPSFSALSLDCEKLKDQYAEVILYAINHSDTFSIVTDQLSPYTAMPPLYKDQKALSPLKPFAVKYESNYDYDPSSVNDEYYDREELAQTKAYYTSHRARITYRCCPEAAEVLLKLPCFLEPLPDGPRDLCFYRREKIWFSIVLSTPIVDIPHISGPSREDKEFFSPFLTSFS